MPRRNLYLILVVCLISAFCYRKADSSHRSHYGRMFDTFVQILEEVERNYVEKVDDRELFEGALHGMVNQLDENSRYLNPGDTARQQQNLDQEFGGIGIEVSYDRDRGAITVLSPIVGSPAFRAGILPGDTIVQVDGDDTVGLTSTEFEETVKRLRGKPGEEVRLKVLHLGIDEPIELVIKREKVQVEAVLGDRRRDDGSWEFMLPGDDKIGYVRLNNNFGRLTLKKLDEAIKRLKDQGLRGLILDLRHNGGGLLEEAVDICNLFVEQGRIVTVKGRDGVELTARDATGNAPYADLPLAVLINGRSASASEIVAACLQDHDRATIVGERSFGKGTVQEIHKLEGGRSAIKLTIATYWRPSNKNIHRGRKATDHDQWGVIPDPGYEVKLTAEQQREIAEWRRDRDLPAKAKSKPAAHAVNPAAPSEDVVDPQLQKGIEAVKERLVRATAPRTA